MTDTATVHVKEVKTIKEGTNNKGKWTLYGLVDGNEDLFSFLNNRTLYDEAKKYEGQQAAIEYEITEKDDKHYRNLKAISDPPKTNGGTPALGTGDYITGQKAPIDARRIGSATAAYVGAELTSQFLKHRNPTREITPDYVRSIFDAMENHVYQNLARRGEYLTEEPPF